MNLPLQMSCGDDFESRYTSIGNVYIILRPAPKVAQGSNDAHALVSRDL